MKKLILFIVALTLPILSQADTNPEDSTRVLWKQIHGEGSLFIWTPAYFTADGKHIINTAHYQGPVSPHINAIQKRSVETGEVVKEVDVGTPSRFRDLQLTPDGKYLIVAKFEYYTIEVRDAETLELIREIEIPNKNTSEEEPFKWIQFILSARLLPDNQTLAVSVTLRDEKDELSTTLLLYDFQTGEFIEEIILFERKGVIQHLRPTPDGKYLFSYPSGSNASVKVIDMESKKVVRNHDMSSHSLEDFALSNDGMKYMYSTYVSPNIYIYNTYGNPFPKQIDYRGGGTIRDIGFIDNSPYILFDSGKEPDGLILYDYEADRDYSLGVNIYGKPTFRNEDNLLLSYGTSFISLSYLNIPQITSVSDPIETAGTIYPNPGVEEITLEFSLEKSGSGEILLFDSIGNEIEILGSQYFNVGNNIIPLSISQYAAGTYIIKVKTESEIITFKMIKR